MAGKKLILVSCKTNLQSDKEMTIEVGKLRRARHLIGFRERVLTYVIVYAKEPEGVLKNKGDVVMRARRFNVEVWFLSDIIRELINLVRKRSKTASFGRYDWLLSWMIRFGLVSEV